MADSEYLTFSVQDEYDAWKRISKDFTSRLPLRNLIWKGGLSQTSRFVEQLNIKVTTDDDHDRDTLPLAAMQTSALLHIYLAESPDSEADTYKSITKPRIKNWIDKVSPRKGSEWLVVYLTNDNDGAMRTATAKFLNMRTSVADRLKSDFQGKKDAERVVTLQTSQIESWNAVFLAIRDRVVQALERRAAAMAEEIRRMDANRMLPGWNYCKFFVVKEGLVNLYRLMGQKEEALAQYDELEAAFFQLLESQSLSWFTKFGGGEPGDDFTDVLDGTRKPYRKQMVENTISMFDFRMYLFGRQAELLIGLERYGEFIERAERFVPTFAKAMRAPGTGLSLGFVASWTYSTCQNIVEVCEGVQVAQSPGPMHVRASTNNHTTMRLLAAAKAEFLTSARRQLDILGTLHDRLPPSYLRHASTYTHIPSKLLETPDDSDGEKEEAAPRDEKGKLAELRRARARSSSAAQRYQEFVGSAQITNPVLTEALASDGRFDQIYVRTCHQATQYYQECGRRRFAQVLQGDIAQLHICRESWVEASQVLRPLISGQPGGGMGIMDVHLVERLALCERRLGNYKECLQLMISLLVVNARFLDKAALAAHAEQLVELAGLVDSSVRVDAAMFRLADIEAVDLEESLAVDIEILSALPIPVEAAEVRVVLANAGSGHLEITMDAKDVAIESGKNRLQLTTDSVSCPGRFAVRLVEIHIGKVVFCCAISGQDNQHVIRLNEHPTNAFVSVEPAPITDSDGPTCVCVVVVESRRHPIDAGMQIRLFGSQGHPLVNALSSIVGGNASIVDGAVVVLQEAMEPETTVTVMLGAVDLPTDHITVYAEYKSGAKRRMFLDSDLVEVAAPVVVSAQYNAMGTKSAVLVTAKCRSVGPVRVMPRTDGASAAAVRGFLGLGESATDVYEFAHDDNAAQNIELSTEIAYVPLFAVVRQEVSKCVRQLAQTHGLAAHGRYLVRLVLAHLRQALDVQRTLRELRLVVTEPLVSLWVVAASDASAPGVRASVRRLFSQLDTVLAETALPLYETGQESALVRRVRVRFSHDRPDSLVPSIEVAASDKFCHVYEPTRFTVRLQIPHSSASISARIRLDVDDGEWLVSGAVAQEVSEDRVVSFVMVPLQVGYLKPPRVVCLINDREGANYRVVKACVAYAQQSTCVLANDKVPSVYTVPILV